MTPVFSLQAKNKKKKHENANTNKKSARAMEVEKAEFLRDAGLGDMQRII